jgi:CO dehydrogenase maturation factor
MLSFMACVQNAEELSGRAERSEDQNRKKKGSCRKRFELKIAVSGKGGVGKTTFSAVLARLLASREIQVFAIDADPDANLATAVGVPESVRIVPLAQMRELIRERTEAGEGGYGVFFKLNPTVSDIPDKFFVEHGGVKVLVLGAVQIGGGGCACPENVFLKALLNHLVLQRDEVVIVDMEAGIEHLGRATVMGIDVLVVVIEPGRHSIETARRIESLAGEIGLKRVVVVVNKVRDAAQEKQLLEHLGAMEVLGSIHFDEKALNSDIEGVSPYDASESMVEDVRTIYEKLVTSLSKAGKE